MISVILSAFFKKTNEIRCLTTLGNVQLPSGICLTTLGYVQLPSGICLTTLGNVQLPSGICSTTLGSMFNYPREFVPLPPGVCSITLRSMFNYPRECVQLPSGICSTTLGSTAILTNDFISKMCKIVPSESRAGAVGEPSGNRRGAAGSEQHGLNEHEK